MTTYLTTSEAELWLVTPGFDDLLLTGETVDDAGNQFTIKAQAADTSWGNPEPVDVAVQRWMAEGAVAVTQGHDNRGISFNVVVSAGTAAELAAGETALTIRSRQSSLLTWYPPSGSDEAPASVFEVWTWHLTHDFDLDRENRLTRVYGVAMTAKPWVRSLDLTTVAAVATAAAPSITSIDTCASTTGWTGSPSAPTTSGGAIRETFTETKVGVYAGRTLTRTGLVTGLGTKAYLTIDASAKNGTLSLFVKIDNVQLTKAAQIGTTSYWALPAGTTSFTTLTIVGFIVVSRAAAVEMAVADVSATDTVGAIGSGKQFVRSLDVGGSVKTAGSLKVASPSATALGAVLVYTRPDDGSGYTPPLRQFRTSGNTVSADGTCVSGFHEALVNAGAAAGTITYTIPAGLLPEGTYAVVGRFLFSAASTMTATVASSMTGGIGNPDTIVGTVGAIGLSTSWGILGVLHLPLLAIPTESLVATVITISATATAAATVTIDDLYLINLTDGAMTLLSPGIAGMTRMWVDASDADPVRNRPAVYLGTLDDRSDAFGAPYFALRSLGAHEFDPLGTIVFTVTDNVDNAGVTAAAFQRWHTNPEA